MLNVEHDVEEIFSKALARHVALDWSSVSYEEQKNERFHAVNLSFHRRECRFDHRREIDWWAKNYIEKDNYARDDAGDRCVESDIDNRWYSFSTSDFSPNRNEIFDL